MGVLSLIPLPLKIALRFLSSSRREKPLMMFSLITIGGIAVAVCLFFAVETLAASFSSHMRDVLVGFHAPVVIEETQSGEAKTRVLLKTMQESGKLTGVKYFSGYETFALLEDQNGEVTGVRVRGVDMDFFSEKPSSVKIYWQDGFDERSFTDSAGAVLLGEDLYKNLPWPDSDEDLIRIVNPFADVGPSGELEPRVKPFVIAGFVATGSYDIDHLYVFLPKTALRDFGNQALMSHKFFLYPDHLGQTDQLVNDLVKNAIPPSRIKTWVEQNKNLFQAMQLERIVFMGLFFVILVISVVNLVSVVRLFGLSKKQEMTLLRALGLRRQRLIQIGLWLGILLSGSGAFCGVVSGVVVLLLVRLSGFVLPEAYGHQELHLVVEPLTVLLLLGLTPVVGAVVSYWPLMRSIRQSVVQELKSS